MADDDLDAADGDTSLLLKALSGEDSDAESDDLVIGESQELQLDTLPGQEDNEGGLGRHLGLYSTTLLM